MTNKQDWLSNEQAVQPDGTEREGLNLVHKVLPKLGDENGKYMLGGFANAIEFSDSIREKLRALSVAELEQVLDALQIGADHSRTMHKYFGQEPTLNPPYRRLEAAIAILQERLK